MNTHRDTDSFEIKYAGKDFLVLPLDDAIPKTFPPEKEDVFLMKAPKMVASLMSDAENNAALALHRLMRHIHNVGELAPNTASLRLAKLKLEELVSKNKKKK